MEYNKATNRCVNTRENNLVGIKPITNLANNSIPSPPPEEAHADEQVAAAVSDLTKRNVTVQGKRTTIRLEPALWQALENIARMEDTSINQLCGDIASRQHGPSFTSAVRVFIVHYYMYAAQSPEPQSPTATATSSTPYDEGVTTHN